MGAGGVRLVSVSPGSGPVGALVTLKGKNFGADQGTTGSVMLGSNQGLVGSWSDTEVTAIVAPGSTSGVAEVTQDGPNGMTSNSLPFNVATPTISGVSTQSASIGDIIEITGSGFGTGGEVILGTQYGIVRSWADGDIFAQVAPGSMTGVVQVIVDGVASNSYTLTLAAPTIDSNGVNPTTGAAGTSVTINGTGFGTQSTGKVLLGTAYGTVTSWSTTQVVATVALGSSTGVAQIWQSGVGSNTLPFTVTTPNITSVNPTGAGAGTQVTITGTGLGSSQCNGQVCGNVWLGTAYAATIDSWTIAQGVTTVKATVAAGSGAGVAQVLQNGVWSNALSFTGVIPVITSAPGSGADNTQVTITGSGFGSSQCNGQVCGIVWLGSTTASSVGSWGDGRITATVAANAMTGSIRVQSSAGIWSNAWPFVVPTFGQGNNETIVPSVLSLLVGETRTLQALNSSGQIVTGLAWTSSDPTVASLSTDDPPIITALAAGHVSITAGDASADVTVYSGSALPTGTVIWSAQGDGSGVQRIMPAVPSSTGVADVFAVQNSGNVQAITADGSVAWNFTPTGQCCTGITPDFQGGLIADNGQTLAKVDGMTGQTTSQYTYTNSGWSPVVHTDGTIFTVDNWSLVGIDPATGSAKFTIPLEHWTESVTSNGCASPVQYDDPPDIFQLIIAGDGFAYLLYTHGESSGAWTKAGDFCLNTYQAQDHLSLLRVATDGTFKKISIGDWTEVDSETFHEDCSLGTCYSDYGSSTESGTEVRLSPPSLVTNADQGVALALDYFLPAYCSSDVFDANSDNKTGCVPEQDFNRLLLISSIGAVVSDSNVNVASNSSGFTPILQAEDGTYFGTGVTASNSMDAFDLSGNVKWSVPGFTPVMATADGGVIAKSTSGPVQYVTFDQNGVANGMLAGMPTQSWIQNTYQKGSIDLAAIAPIAYASSFLAMLGGNQTGNGTAIQQVQTNFPQQDVETPPASNAATDLSNYEANYSAVEILTNATPDYIFQNYVQQYRGIQQQDKNSVGYVPDGTNVTGVGQEVTFTLKGPVSLLQGPFKVRMKALDATAHLMAVVTLKGHPLFGRRYWRVFSLGQGDVVVETGAIDTPACPSSPIYETVVFSCTNYWGYYAFSGQQTKIWKGQLQYILNDLPLHGFAAQKGSTPAYNYLGGKWGWDVSFRSNYLWPYLCYASACQ
jgi:IPT/TIG domain